MNIIKKTYCRIFQTVMRIAMPVLPYRDPKILNSVQELPQEFINHKIDTVLLVTDSFIRTLCGPLEEALSKAGIKCIVYDKTQPNPTIANVEEALAIYKENNCKGLIAFGGGSAMDCAKGVGARVANPKKTLPKMKGILKVNRRIPLLAAIPTTAGTGSEVTLAAVITDEKTHHKYPINDFPLIPRIAVLDPQVTFSLPKGLTSTTGMDALTHAIEVLIGRSRTKRTYTDAMQAIELILENIETAYNEPTNETARRNMLFASHLAGRAFSQSYVGYVHAVAHSLGGAYGIPHGLANSVLLPIVLRAYGKGAYKKLADIAYKTKVAEACDNIETAANKIIEKIEKLNENMGIPKKLKGLNPEDFPRLSKFADKEANPLYPVPVLWDANELIPLYNLVKE